MENREKAYKWTFLVYPDSAPEDWKNILENYCIQTAISPLHEPEEKGKEGETKKQHWHIILNLDGQKTYKQIKEISDSLNGARPEKVLSPIGMYEYLIHKNHPDRQQFENGFDEIEHMNGFDKTEFIRNENVEDSVCNALLKVIQEREILEFASLVAYCYEEQPEFLGYLRKFSYFFNSYLRSKKGMYKEYKRYER